MRYGHRWLPVVAALGLTLAACSDDDADGLSDAQQGAVDAGVAQGEALGVTLDESCVEDLAGQLSDEDAQILADGGSSSDLSPEGEPVADQLLTCADEGELVDLFLAGVLGSGDYDEECVREVLESSDLAASLSDTDAQFAIDQALQDCVLR